MDNDGPLPFDPRKRHAVDPLEARSTLVNYDEVPIEVRRRKAEITAAAAVFARTVIDIFKASESFDTGRAIAAIDQITQAKNTACDALVLPHVSKAPQ
jgi:hypothetical protein